MYSRFSLFNFSIRPFDKQKVLLGQNKVSPLRHECSPLKNGVVSFLQSTMTSFIMRRFSFYKE